MSGHDWVNKHVRPGEQSRVWNVAKETGLDIGMTVGRDR